jgi:hypothetical protein
MKPLVEVGLGGGDWGDWGVGAAASPQLRERRRREPRSGKLFQG